MASDGGVVFFSSPWEWRGWLAAHGASELEVWVGLHRVGTGVPSVTWEEAIDEALCFGWIDGVRRKVDEGRYRIRFSPRRVGSRWSAKNVARFEELRAEGRVESAGLAAWEGRPHRGSEPALVGLSAALRARFEGDAEAWAFFEAQPAGYRRRMQAWVMDAKREATRERRLTRLVGESAAGRRIDPMAPMGGRSAEFGQRSPDGHS